MLIPLLTGCNDTVGACWGQCHDPYCCSTILRQIFERKREYNSKLIGLRNRKKGVLLKVMVKATYQSHLVPLFCISVGLLFTEGARVSSESATSLPPHLSPILPSPETRGGAREDQGIHTRDSTAVCGREGGERTAGERGCSRRRGRVWGIWWIWRRRWRRSRQGWRGGERGTTRRGGRGCGERGSG